MAAVLGLGVSLAACAPETSSEGEAGQTVTTQVGTDSGSESESETGAPPSTATVTTTGEGTDSESDSDESTGMMTFVADSDIAALYGVCDPFGQDCPEGEKCVPYSSTGTVLFDSNRCVTVLGDKEPGESCIYGGAFESTDDCDEGSFCYPTQEIDGLEQGTCAAFCSGTPDDATCADTMSCVHGFQGSMALCLAQCDPFVQDCEDPLACHWADDDFNCTPVAADLGEVCSNELDNCAAGQFCISDALVPMCAGEQCCTEFCDLADPSCTNPGTACASFFEVDMAPEGFEDLGVCAII